MKLVKSLEVKKLFEQFDYKIKIDGNTHFTILTAPNGFGKSTLLRILNAIAIGNVYYFDKLKFEQIRLKFTDDSEFVITKQISEAKNSQEKKSDIEFQYGEQRFSRKHSQSDFESESAMISGVFPFLSRVSPTHWRHDQTGDIYEIDDIYEKFGQHPMIRKRIRREPWYDELRSKMSISFISTNRLVSDKGVRTRSENQSRGLMVFEIANTIKAIIDRNILQQFELSRKLETTFANRVIDNLNKRIDVKNEEVAESIKIIQDSENKYKRLGLTTDVAQTTQLTTNISQAESNALIVLDTYLNDIKKKFHLFDKLAEQLELFNNSINKLLQFKVVETSISEGVIVKSKGGLGKDDPIPLSALSSGEQHLLVLIGRLLFSTEENTLVLLDEPEISFHPVWQEKFIAILEDIQKVNKFRVLVATHSPLLIGDNWENVVELAEQVNVEM